jgi:putative Mn2+ efflux pump MntP
MVLLTYVGVNLIRSGLCSENDCDETPNPSKGRTLVLLCIATSLDAMAVGLGMAMIHSPILVPSIVIGIVTLGLSAFGLGVGEKLGLKFGKRMEVLGGLILVFIGLRIVYMHLFV